MFFPQIMSNNSCFQTKRGIIITALIASLVPRLCKQAIISRTFTGHLVQGGAIKCHIEKKILSCLMSGTTFHSFENLQRINVLLKINNFVWIHSQKHFVFSICEKFTKGTHTMFAKKVDRLLLKSLLNYYLLTCGFNVNWVSAISEFR